MHIEELIPGTAAEADLRAHAELSVAIDAERATPGWPGPVESYVRKLRVPPIGKESRHWVAREGDRIVGSARTTWRTLDNPRQAEIEVAVHPDFRGRGIATTLLRPAIDAAHEVGRSMVTTEILHDGPGALFAKARGAEERVLDRRSVLDVTQVDVAEITAWGEPAAGARDRYALVHWRGPCPTELAEDMAALYTAMNDAPREDLDWEDEIVTADLVIDHDVRTAERGFERWTTCVRDTTTGQLVAMTEIERSVDWAEWAFQGNTVVLRAHRGHGLGRWIKAENLSRTMLDAPEVVGIQAFNAVSNSYMVDINEAMGFREVERWGEWQVPLDVLEQSLRPQI